MRLAAVEAEGLQDTSSDKNARMIETLLVVLITLRPASTPAPKLMRATLACLAMR